MAPRAIGTATVSFGLVSIPVKIYSTGDTSSSVRFNMLHADCGTRVKQQYICPTHEDVVPRSDMVKGYEFAKGQYVTISDEEHKALQAVGDQSIGLVEFVPADSVDTVFLSKSYFLGPDKGGGRAYNLLSAAMTETGLIGLANYAARGKQYLVAVCPNDDGGLVMQQLKYADEVKKFEDIPREEAPEATEAEIGLAKQLIDQIRSETFEPQKYKDEVKEKMLTLIGQKIDGSEITLPVDAAPQAQVIDLMAALKASLGEDAEAAPKKTKKAPAKKAAAKKTAKKKKASS